jgi:hypothetical protein
VIGDRRLEDPWRVLASIDLAPLEAGVARRIVDGAHHAQPLRAGERAETTAQVDRPRRPGIALRRADGDGAGNDVEPIGIEIEPANEREEALSRARSVERRGDVQGYLFFFCDSLRS